MEVEKLDEGLWRWTGNHPEWRQEVGCVYLETPDAVVVIDPLVPPEAAERFWEALDLDVARVGAPVHVIVTVFWHARSAGEIARRYGGRLWAPSRSRRAVERRTGLVTDVFRPGDLLPGGVEALATARGGEVVLWIPAHRTLVFGDTLLGDEAGGVRLCPESWLPAGRSHADLRRALRPLLSLPVERVLVSHGEPVRANGHAALVAALAQGASNSR